MKIGFSTGSIHETGLSFPDRIRFFSDLGCKALELGFREEEEIFFSDLAKGKHIELFSSFEYISLHTDPYPDIETMLDIVTKISNKLTFDAVVFHPDLFEPHFDLLERYDLPFAVENMDSKKISYKRPTDLKKIFQDFPEFKFVFDLNHAYVNDRSGDLAIKLFESFKYRLTHFHISGYTEIHEPLYQTKQKEITDNIPVHDFPMIIESSCRTLDEAKKEYEYILCL